MNLKRVGEKFYLDYRFKGRRIREYVGNNRRIAEQLKAKRQTEILEDRFQIHHVRDVRFAEFASEYIESYSRVNKRSWKRDEVSLVSLNPFFGDKLLSEIHPFLIEHYKRKRIQEVKPATVNRELALLKHMFSKAVEDTRAVSNPVKRVKLLREENMQMRILSPEEIEQVLQACSDYSRPIVITALHTGMRLNEILSLRWSQVSFKPEYEEITVLYSKNGRQRKIPINEVLLSVLQTLKKGKGSSELVFAFKGSDHPIRSFKTAWLNALRRANIDRYRFHDLRHTFASNLVAAGVDLVRVKELLGHQSILTTMRYAHAVQQEKRSAVELLKERYMVKSGHKTDTLADSSKTAIYLTRSK